jgi:hypothetical protein
MRYGEGEHGGDPSEDLTSPPTIRPPGVTGTWSPYPTVVKVVRAHHTLSPQEPKVRPGAFRSVSHAAVPPSTTAAAATNDTTADMRRVVALALLRLLAVTLDPPDARERQPSVSVPTTALDSDRGPDFEGQKAWSASP